MNEVKITTDYITLGQFLKFIGFVSNGSDAKFILKSLKIVVNNEPEGRRGRKLFSNDVVIIENKEYLIK